MCRAHRKCIIKMCFARNGLASFCQILWFLCFFPNIMIPLSEHLSFPPPGFSQVRVARSLVFCVMFCRSLFVLLSFFAIVCLSFNLQFLITGLVSSNQSCDKSYAVWVIYNDTFHQLVSVLYFPGMACTEYLFSKLMFTLVFPELISNLIFPELMSNFMISKLI